MPHQAASSMDYTRWDDAKAIASGRPRINLLKHIAAIQLDRTENGSEKLGLVSQLPQGAELDICGDGFSARTAKVRWAGQLNFVQDLTHSDNTS
jgi:hypothetical protein